MMERDKEPSRAQTRILVPQRKLMNKKADRHSIISTAYCAQEPI